MARKLRKSNARTLPSRLFMQRIGHVFLLSMLLLLLLAGKHGHPALRMLEARLGDLLTPVLLVAAAPLQAVDRVQHEGRAWIHTYRDNAVLRQEQRELLQWQQKAKELEVENRHLRSLLEVVPPQARHFVTATILSEHGSAFSHAALVHAGTEEGVKADQAVMSARGLMGRVLYAGQHSARILLLTDINSRIPVMNERTREKMILVGKGTDWPALNYVAADSRTRKGDRLMTSGDGGVFPKNIPVGMVRDRSESGMTVDLFAHIGDIEYVSILAE